MRLDKYSNPIFNEQDLFDALYKGQTLSSEIFVEPNDEIKSLEATAELKFWKPLDDYDISLEEYDSSLQTDWNMPDEYKTLDIEQWIWQQCPPWDPQHTRVSEELEAYKARNMLDLLRWLKYFVDTCSKEEIVWGVGRGSSVASYVLYLIGVHAIDSIKYNLDWQEFLR
jgi:DNA polymerase III alpha subunit